MFSFQLEPEIPLLTVTQTGLWTVATVSDFESEFRRELALLQISGRPTALIVDIRDTFVRNHNITEALRSMIERLGQLQADRTAVVSLLGFAKLQAGRIRDPNARIFTSMDRARDWLTSYSHTKRQSVSVNDQPSDASPEGLTV
ncbi:hypothetical protein U1707_18395, partial [Sphingomonas sp. PB2P12]|uniref:hypothetical protein n=1 Tax=Sphingomonas sandaracina TaxID=3096157 RepID=UPI002FC8D37C